MACIKTVPAECTIKIGGLTIKTPFVLGCRVARQRGNPVGVAEGSFQIQEEQLGQIGATGSNLVIYLYSSVIFTGSVQRIDASPSSRCAGEMIVRFQGEDAMHRVLNRAITRRQKNAGLGPLAFISGHSSGRTTVGFDSVRDAHDISGSSSPVTVYSPTINMAEMTQFIKGGESSTIGAQHPRTKLADPFQSGASSGGTGGSNFFLHDHSTLATEGPFAGGSSLSTYGVK